MSSDVISAPTTKNAEQTHEQSSVSTKRKLNVAFIDDRYHEVYGAQENVLLLAESAAACGHKSLFVTTYAGPLSEACDQRDIPHAVIEAPPRLRVFYKAAINSGWLNTIRTAIDAFLYSFKFHKVMRRENIDIIVASGVRSSLLLARSKLSRKTKVLLFAQNSVPMGVFAAASLPGTDRIGYISTGVGTTFPGWALKPFHKRVRMLPSGRDFSQYTLKPEPADSQSRKLHVVSVCQLNERKGLHVLLEAIAIANRTAETPIQLTVVGGTSGPDSEAYLAGLEQQVAEHQLNVDFTGWTDDVVQHLHNANVFALASFHEGLPGVILEAMATGLPIITTASGGSADAIVEGNNGFVVPVGDERALADRLLKLQDPVVRKSMGHASNTRATQVYTIDAYYQRFEELAYEMIDG